VPTSTRGKKNIKRGDGEGGNKTGASKSTYGRSIGATPPIQKNNKMALEKKKKKPPKQKSGDQKVRRERPNRLGKKGDQMRGNGSGEQLQKKRGGG